MFGLFKSIDTGHSKVPYPSNMTRTNSFSGKGRAYKTHGGGPSPSSQTVGSLLRTPFISKIILIVNEFRMHGISTNFSSHVKTRLVESG
jgi:hypothetical protein